MEKLNILNKFPPDFLFGTATSSYQIEGNSYGECGKSHWDDFSQKSGKVRNRDNGSIACAHYIKYKEDLELAGKAGFSARNIAAKP